MRQAKPFVSMQHANLPRLIAAVVLALTLSACRQWNIPFLDSDEPEQQQPQPATTGDEPATDTDSPATPVTLGQIVASLQAGESASARRQLDRYLERNPDSPTARELLRQLDADPQQYLGAESFAYRVRPGDTLADIAAKHLGDPLKFYALARYNGIDRPELLYPGQILRIPGQRADDDRAPQRAEPLQEAERYLAMNKFERALDALEGIDADQRAQGLRGQGYRGLIRARLAAGDVETARDWLQIANEQQPESGAWQEWLQPLGNRTQVAYWRQAGDVAYSEGRKLDALQAYDEAARFNWGVEATRQRLAEIRGELVREYHEAALINYRNQRLDRAITLWTRALTVDPDFERARLYRERAKELKQRLRALGSADPAAGEG